MSSNSLETLPTELLEPICFTCLNPNLPLTCHQIHEKLNSTSIIRQYRILAKKTEFIVHPDDRRDGQAHSYVGKELKRITGLEVVDPYIDFEGRLLFWPVELNVLERREVERIDGVHDVMNNRPVRV